jgi:DNA-binding transcriptional regulator PaaX
MGSMAQSRTAVRATAKNTLKALGLAGAVSTALVAPNSTILIESIMKRADKKKAQKTLSYLKYHNLVEVEERNGNLFFKLTSKGRDRFERIMLDELNIKTPRKWDKKWRMIIFDIPSNKNTQRKQLLFYFRTLNFYMLQNSVWIHPFECKKEIGALLSYLQLEPYVTYVLVEDGNFVEHAIGVYKKADLLM